MQKVRERQVRSWQQLQRALKQPRVHNAVDKRNPRLAGVSWAFAGQRDRVFTRLEVLNLARAPRLRQERQLAAPGNTGDGAVGCRRIRTRFECSSRHRAQYTGASLRAIVRCSSCVCFSGHSYK